MTTPIIGGTRARGSTLFEEARGTSEFAKWLAKEGGYSRVKWEEPEPVEPVEPVP